MVHIKKFKKKKKPGSWEHYKEKHYMAMKQWRCWGLVRSWFYLMGEAIGFAIGSDMGCERKKQPSAGFLGLGAWVWRTGTALDEWARLKNEQVCKKTLEAQCGTSSVWYVFLFYFYDIAVKTLNRKWIYGSDIQETCLNWRHKFKSTWHEYGIQGHGTNEII